jgi:predicted nucleic acid-binding protein
MKAVYLESSAVVRWLFSEPGSDLVSSALKTKGALVTSVLTFVEAERALSRAKRDKLLTDGQAAKLQGLLANAERSWSVMEISAAVRARARTPFPREPVRTLDAIHLATALEFARVYDPLTVLSFDARVIENLEPLGLPAREDSLHN